MTTRERLLLARRTLSSSWRRWGIHTILSNYTINLTIYIQSYMLGWVENHFR